NSLSGPARVRVRRSTRRCLRPLARLNRLMAMIPIRGAMLLVGAGKMGGALLEGWLANGIDPRNVSVLDPAPSLEMAKLLTTREIDCNPDPKTFKPIAIVVAVKPQMAKEVVPQL